MSKNNIKNALAKRLENQSDIDKKYDEMYGLDSGAEKIINVNIDLLSPHPKDPFKPYTEEKLLELSQSIKNVGLLDAVLIRPKPNTTEYEILSGKNRTNAVRFNGENTIKAVVKEVDEETAIMIITDSNLKHREKLLPSEKGWAYRLQLEAITCQGKRNDLSAGTTSAQIEQKSNVSRKKVAERNEVKESEIQRFIRLTYLTKDLLDCVDNNTIPMNAGYHISYLDETAQSNLLKYLKEYDFKHKISIKIAQEIRDEFEKENFLSEKQVEQIFDKKIHNNISSSHFSIKRDKLAPFLEKLPADEELEKLFIEFLTEKYGA